MCERYANCADLIVESIVQLFGNIRKSLGVALILDVARRIEDLDHVVFLFTEYGGQTKSVASHSGDDVRYLPR